MASSADVAHMPPPRVFAIVTAGIAAALCTYLAWSNLRSNPPEETTAGSQVHNSLHRSNAVRHPRRRDDFTAEQIARLEELADADANTDAGAAPSNNASFAQRVARFAEELDEAPRNTGSEAEQIALVAAADEVTELSIDSHPGDPADEDDGAIRTTASNAADPGQRVREVLFAINKFRASQEIIHRGVTCNQCHAAPIRGIRYHCMNCEDFDLCADCEDAESHPKTHVFYKIRTPVVSAGKTSQRLWYPGHPEKLPALLPALLKQWLCEQTGASAARVEGLYAQFTALANEEWEADPNRLKMAINRRGFDQCLVPQHPRRGVSSHNLVYESLFRFYDEDRNGLIGFEEFLRGTLLAHFASARDPDEQRIFDLRSHDRESVRRTRIFKAMDLNDDGFVSRQDFLLFYRSYFLLNKSISEGYIVNSAEVEDWDRVVEGRASRHFVESGRNLAGYFADVDRPEFLNDPEDLSGKQPPNGLGDRMPWEEEDDKPEDAWTEDRAGPRELSISGTWVLPEKLMLWDFELMRQKTEPLYTPRNQIRILNTPEHWMDVHARENFRSVDNQLWAVKDASFYSTGYIRVTDDDLEKAAPGQLDHSHLLQDVDFYEKVLKISSARICRDIDFKKEINGIDKLLDHERYEQFYLEDEETGTPMQEDGKSLDVPEGDERHYIGGSKSIAFIHGLVQSSLNELLDPMFRPCETEALVVQKTAIWLQHAQSAWALFKASMDEEAAPKSSEQEPTRAKDITGILSYTTRLLDYYLQEVSEKEDRLTALLKFALAFEACEDDMQQLGSTQLSIIEWLVVESPDITTATESEIAVEWDEEADLHRLSDELVHTMLQRLMFVDEWRNGKSSRLSTSAISRTGHIAHPRPDVSASTRTRPREGQDEDLEYVPELDELADAHHKAAEMRRRGGAGRITADEFGELLAKTDDAGAKLLAWVESWLDLVLL